VTAMWTDDRIHEEVHGVSRWIGRDDGEGSMNVLAEDAEELLREMRDEYKAQVMPLWDDELIITRYKKAFHAFPSVHMMAFILWMRDEYEAKIAELETLIKFIDDNVPLADDTCVVPGLTLSQASRAMLNELKLMRS